jgi:pimeloyl-ACP methyl ester carboxylesterase
MIQELRALRAEGISEFIVAGHSMGALLATLYAAYIGKTLFNGTRVGRDSYGPELHTPGMVQ